MAVPASDLDATAELRATALAPLVMRRNEDAVVVQSFQDEFPARNRKRRRSPYLRDTVPRCNTRLAHFAMLADGMLKELEVPVAGETIHLCGLAPLHIIAVRPREVLALAEEKLSTFPYSEVHVCWRRLFEDASAYIAGHLLKVQSSMRKWTRQVSPTSSESNQSAPKDWLSEIIHVVDRAIVMSGAPGRRSLFDWLLKELHEYASVDASATQRTWQFQRPEPLLTTSAIMRVDEALSFPDFDRHLHSNRMPQPLVMPDVLSNWPASQKWHDLSYLLHQTHGGRRLVPVEVGRSYVDEDWAQRVIPFSNFVDKYLIHNDPEDIGYLAQHDLLSQIPALRADIMIPDYCWTIPPPVGGPAARTVGLPKAAYHGEPLINTWLGPKGTKTPLHTDAYHNILCQVCGYKYVRLYSPEETSKLYPFDKDEAGIDMSNTSQIDVDFLGPRLDPETCDKARLSDRLQRFPLFEQAKYTEAILSPDECLYIPLGYWHYVESLTASFSVSFWWK